MARKRVNKEKNFSIYYSGTRDQIAQVGTGFLLLGWIGEKVIPFEAMKKDFVR